jgi:hypothetical protein
MTYALSATLQAALFQRLAQDAALAALLGGHLYDALPPGPPPALYLVLGPETARDRSDASGRGAEHDLTLSVHSDAPGFAQAKAAAALICDALAGGGLALARGRLLSLRFLRAAALREGEGRRIDLVFRARVDDAPAQP